MDQHDIIISVCAVFTQNAGEDGSLASQDEEGVIDPTSTSQNKHALEILK
jgi:hypothetical protein